MRLKKLLSNIWDKGPMQYLVRRRRELLTTLCQKLYQTHGGRWALWSSIRRKGVPARWPKVLEAMDNQLRHEISGRHAELGSALGEVLKCNYKEIAHNTSMVSLRRLVGGSATWI
jgi:hypothetical protein